MKCRNVKVLRTKRNSFLLYELQISSFCLLLYCVRSLSPAVLCSFACFTWHLLTDVEHKVQLFYCMKQINQYWMNFYAVWSIHVGICMMVKNVHVLCGKNTNLTWNWLERRCTQEFEDRGQIEWRLVAVAL
jgi:hypothetical protein